MKKKEGFLYYVYNALGEKSHPNCNKTADRVAFIRLVITLQILITNFFIIFGVIKHWNDVPSTIPSTQEKGLLKTDSNIHSS